MNFDKSSSAAARPLSNSFSFSVKSSTGFLARFSLASITFFCCFKNLSSWSRSSSNFRLTSSGRLPPGRFFISADKLDLRLPHHVEQLLQHGDDLVLRGRQLGDFA